MEISYSLCDLLLYLLVYSFLGWAAEVLVVAIRDRHFVNRGFLNVPFALPYGITAVILIVVLPTLNGNLLLQYVQCLITCWAVSRVTEQTIRMIRREKKQAEPDRKQRFAEAAVMSTAAGVYLIVYLIIHPLLFGLSLLLPELLVKITVILFAVLIAVDLGCVVYSLRNHVSNAVGESTRARTSRLADRICGRVRNRLDKNYPGILENKDGEHRYVFAEGLCLDKLLWVFLVSSFLGALIEMVFVRVTGGTWMNRSSVLYGTFSFVWGFGAVILTITLQRLAGKADRYVFLAGFVVGGAYEYLCSVFTELVFGTVFWDYSHMPLNIGGRTNVLYCIFWGLLAVVWVKMLYPPMSGAIEKIPALPGKILTWVLAVVMVCNGVLTMAAMIRYTDRQNDPTPQNAVEQFLDTRYDDEWMEKRWPNMVVAEE